MVLFNSHRLRKNDGIIRQCTAEGRHVVRSTTSHSRLRGQSSMEFIIIFSLLLTILAIVASAASVRLLGVSIANKELEVSNVLDEVSGKINLAFLEGDGFQIQMEIPPRLLNNNYSISIYKNNVVIYVENSTYSAYVMTENVTGTINKGISTLYNRKGEIVIS